MARDCGTTRTGARWLTDNPAFEARRLVRAAAAGSLATQAGGQPFASLVTPAAAPDLWHPAAAVLAVRAYPPSPRRAALRPAVPGPGRRGQPADRAAGDADRPAAPVPAPEVAALKARFLAKPSRCRAVCRFRRFRPLAGHADRRRSWSAASPGRLGSRRRSCCPSRRAVPRVAAAEGIVAAYERGPRRCGGGDRHGAARRRRAPGGCGGSTPTGSTWPRASGCPAGLDARSADPAAVARRVRFALRRQGGRGQDLERASWSATARAAQFR